jgi:hypothetical protein
MNMMGLEESQMVPGARIERAPPDFQSGAMTSSATQAYC